MTSAFSSAESSALDRTVDTAAVPLQLSDIWTPARHTECCDWIVEHAYRRVCLQFPDELLPFSARIADELRIECRRRRSGSKTNENQQHRKEEDAETTTALVDVYILGDTSYGSCCVDEVAASHINADAIIHFGHACLSRVIRLPLLYVFYTYRLDAAQFVDAVRVKATACERLFVFYNAGYFYELDNLKAACNAAGLRSIQFARLAVDREADKLCWHLNGDDLTDVPCVYIGRDDQTFFNLTLSLRTAVPEWLLCDPSALVVDDAAEPPLRLQSRTPNTTAWMRRRNYYIETCKDARTLGIVVGTLAARGYLDIVRHVQAMARHRNVRTYLISVGKVNPAKLANFMEIDCFVLVGCPENDLFTSRDFYKPLLSVYEVEMALNAAWQRQQAPDYSLEFADVLPAGRLHRRFDAAALATPEADAEESDVSLVTGRVRNVRVADAAAADDDADDAAGAVLLKRNHQLIGTGADGGALANRTWTGLDASLGNVKPALVEMGRSGLAIRYDEVDSTNK